MSIAFSLMFIHRLTLYRIGAFGFGILTDIIGRKWAFQITCLITSVFGMLLVRFLYSHSVGHNSHIQAACKYNYGAICGIYFLSCIGLGGNVPIDATIALESLPQNRRYLVSLLGMWQPIGVTVASAIAYGTAARYRCDVKLPACTNVKTGEACCTVSSNMGWRYMVIIIGAMTLTIFFARYLIFRFHESPKFLVSKGREQDAIDVLHKIARFNGAEMPTLTLEDFREIDRAAGVGSRQDTTPKNAKGVFKDAMKSLGFLRGLFLSKLQAFSFCLLAVAYMVSNRSHFWAIIDH